MSELSNLPNIAQKLSAQLASVGVTTAEELRRVGSKEAWLRILAVYPSACYVRLCALDGAVRGVRWHDLPSDVKQDLKNFCNKAKWKYSVDNN